MARALPRPQTPVPRGGVGFTLVEVMVVVALTGLLVGLLLPALTRSRDAARAVVCLSQLRQLGVSLNAYLVNRDGRLPTLNNRARAADPGPALDTLFAQAPGLHACTPARQTPRGFTVLAGPAIFGTSPSTAGKSIGSTRWWAASSHRGCR